MRKPARPHGLKPLLAHQSTLPATPEQRGYSMLYRPDRVNHCPGCGRTHWYIGRISAECGFCATTVPLAEGGKIGAGAVRRRAFEVAA